MRAKTSEVKKINIYFVLIVIGSLSLLNLDAKKPKSLAKSKTQTVAQKNLVTFGTLIFY